MSRMLDVGTTLLGAGARLGTGLFASDAGPHRPERRLELYEMENCPFCRKVRDALTQLDLDADIYPCPPGSDFRERVRALGGKIMVPFLVDPNTGTEMYESDDIIDYLYAQYGRGRPPMRLKWTATSVFASAVRPARGRRGKAARRPAQLLELYSFEGSPFSRLVREALCELQIPYTLRNVGKGAVVDFLIPGVRSKVIPGRPQTTEKRKAFVERSGRMQVPWLVDPNTGRTLFESADIVRYLHETYGGE